MKATIMHVYTHPISIQQTPFDYKMLQLWSNATTLTIRALCALGILLFLIAGTIILSLIPLYLPNHASTLTNIQDQTQLFYVEYLATVNNGTVTSTGFITNLQDASQQYNKQLNLPSNTIIIRNIQLIQQTSSQKRSVRNKRALDYKMLLTCQANYPRACRFSSCRQLFLDDIQQTCANHSNIVLQLQSTAATDQTVEFNLKFISFNLAVPQDFTTSNSEGSTGTSTTSTLTKTQLIQRCVGQDTSKQPVIIDTDTDVDDLWAVLYLLTIPTIDILAITTVGNGYSSPFYSASNILTLLGLVDCTDGIAVSGGLSTSYLETGWIIADSILKGIDTYMTSSTCLNQSANIYLQPSPFEAIELLIYTLKYSPRPVDILVLGTMTNLAAAITRDRSIISKIGTIYVSGGQFKPISNYSSLVPDTNVSTYPYSHKTSGSSSNIFLDVLAVQRVDDSGINKFVAMPSSVQGQLPANLTQLNIKLKELNLTLPPFIYGLITSLARCTNQSESAISWWDNSAAQLMIQMQNNVSNGFCTSFQNVQSLYILSASADQLFGQGLIDFEKTRPNTRGLSNYTICTQTNSDIFLTEFLTKIASKERYSCETIYENRFDLKLQSCLDTYGYD